MITLYHGSNVEIAEIDLSRSRFGKDFGCGFYLNADLEQAFAMAERTARRMDEGTPTVNAYRFDETALSADNILRTKMFDDYTVEWAEFVLANRQNKCRTPIHPYDIVVGPIADDTVGVQLRRFLSGYIDIHKMIDELRYHNQPAYQYFFGTSKAVALLEKIKSR